MLAIMICEKLDRLTLRVLSVLETFSARRREPLGWVSLSSVPCIVITGHFNTRMLASMNCSHFRNDAPHLRTRENKIRCIKVCGMIHTLHTTCSHVSAITRTENVWPKFLTQMQMNHFHYHHYFFRIVRYIFLSKNFG